MGYFKFEIYCYLFFYLLLRAKAGGVCDRFVMSFFQSLCRSVSRGDPLEVITRERVNGRRSNMVGMCNG